jgi:hypothetical protein
VRERSVSRSLTDDFAHLRLASHLYGSHVVSPTRDESSYDRIVRRTLVEPDQARHRMEPVVCYRWRTLTMIETETLVRIHNALTSDPVLDLDDLADVELGIDGAELIVIGSVPASPISARLEQVVKMVAGIDHIDNQLVIRSTH